MNLLDSEVVANCRDRDGRPKAKRPSHVEKALSRPKLGHREGMPLVGDGYDEYPTKDELAHPKSGSFVIELLSHYLISSYEDAVTELTGVSGSHLDKYKDALKKAVNLFGLDADILFNAGEAPNGDQLGEILGETPSDHVISSLSPTLIAEMYARGLGVGEIVAVLENHTGEGVSEGQVRDKLKQTALLEGKPPNDADRQGSVPLAEEDVRLGGTSVEFNPKESPDSDGSNLIVR